MTSMRDPATIRIQPINRHTALGLSDDAARAMYEQMLFSRKLDERMWALNRQGKAPFVISSWGQEAAQVGAAWALRPGEDYVVAYYRDMALVLTLGVRPVELLLGLLARKADPGSGSRQMPMHFSYPPLKIVTRSSVVGTQVPHAAGIALASKIKGEPFVTYCSIGEGGTSEGDWHEGLNFAGIHRLPVIFVVQNNQYAISVPQSKQMPIKDVSTRAAGYGMPGVTVDGNDVLAMYEAMRDAVQRARQGAGPTLIEAKTYRLMAHSSDDDDRIYRARDEVDGWKHRDPIDRYRRYLEEQGLLTEAIDREIQARFRREIDQATEEAERAPMPAPSELALHVYAA